MLSTLFAVASIATTPTVGAGHSCEFEPGGRLGVLIARAWDEEQDKKADDKHQAALKSDIELGKEYSKEVEKTLKVSKNEEMISRVNRIGAELAAIANVTHAKATWGDRLLNPFPYSFKVIEGTDVNAFSLPGGIIYVYEGLVKYAESDDELAGVLAHEIAHAAFRHVPTLQREQSKLGVLTIPLIIATIITGGATAPLLQGSQLAGQAMSSSWSVKAEKAADFGGFQYLEHSKYNPTGMLTFMERLAQDENVNPVGFVDWGIYRTHPPSKERATSLTAFMKEANVPVRRSAVTKSFRTQIKPGEAGAVEAWFNGKKLYVFRGTDALKRADDAAIRLDAFFDELPAMYSVKVGNDGAVIGNGKVLLKAVSDDGLQKESPEALADEAAKGLKGALFTLTFQIWGSQR